jgi:ubiquinone/menaquinone biosynthesis C-methylase UbiE
MGTIAEEGAVSEADSARKYAERHKKYVNFMYRGILKDIKASGISGNYLEVGAGPGLLAVRLAQQNPEIKITAVDLWPDMAAVANEYISENGLEDKIRYIVGDVNDRGMLQKLGKFNFVYSTFSLHAWKAPEEALRNLWALVEHNGMLYIYDFKRIGWLCSLPLRGKDIEAMRASYSAKEIRVILRKIAIPDCRITAGFPFLFQSISARKALT